MIVVTCGHCDGCGSVELTGETLLTYYALLAAGECHAVALAAEMGCKATAMNNRLTVLEEYGLATSRRWGRKRLYTATPNKELP